MSIRISKGGKLIETNWVYDKEKNDGKYIDQDVTKYAIRRLMEPCTLGAGVTLRDVFELINTELEIFDLIIGNWCKEIVTEGLVGEPKKVGFYDPGEIEYLTLGYYASYNSIKKSNFAGFHRPDFGGVGWELKENIYFDWEDPHTGEKEIEHHMGSRISWGVSFTPANELADLPLILEPLMKVYESDTEGSNYMSELFTFKDPEYTLFGIIQGIIWELSFHGSPQDRESTKSNCDERINKFVEYLNEAEDEE
jgi:hypothetical protein